MTVYAKDPDAVLDYDIDWTAYLNAGETLDQSDWHILPSESEGLALVGQSISGKRSSATFSGGMAGHIYKVTNRVTTSAGRTDDRSLAIRLSER